jgi:thymidylate synthase (FAD)
MAKLLPYTAMSVKVLQQTPDPGKMLKRAVDITMKSDFTDYKAAAASGQLCKFIMTAEHTSLFEHCVMTIFIQNASRSFLAQITRQRTFSPTSGSQHYQDYRDYPMMVHPQVLEHAPTMALFNCSFNESVGWYAEAIDKLGVPPEEARQLLPNACAVNYMVTMDVRNILFFLRQRLCHRNVYEMRIFANILRGLCLIWWPEVFANSGPACFADGKCNQGKMACGRPWRTDEPI